MLAQGVAPRVAQAPAVRVPTLEPSTSSSSLFTGTRMFRSNPNERQMQASTLSDHYRPAQVGTDQQYRPHTAQLRELESPINTVKIEELLRSVRATSTAAVAAMGELTDDSPPPRQITSSQQRTPCEGCQWRSASPDRVHTARSSPMKRTPRGESPARPAWNQNRPTPRVKPTVSAPRTEPRRVTRDASIEHRSRPWMEGIKLKNSSRCKLTAERDKNHQKFTPVIQSQPSHQVPTCARRVSSVGVGMSSRTVSGGTGGLKTGNDEVAFQPRVEFLEESLRDVQQRAVRAEARCEELEAALQALALEHRESISRLEERNVQLNARVQHVLQWIEHVDATRVAREVFAQEVEMERTNESGDVEAPSQSLSINNDVGDPPGIEKAVKATPVRVPPAPPMTLQIQHR
ncbi:hypothetical protein TcBrA4_0100780 [Trypanosoma cruzi]|nr:hypothetical protein TcBrA4_0100780 [Trypanosoma cruzi]